MSRRYCAVCREPHQNGGLGQCDAHLLSAEEARRESQIAADSAFDAFMRLEEYDRWAAVFDAMMEARK